MILIMCDVMHEINRIIINFQLVTQLNIVITNNKTVSFYMYIRRDPYIQNPNTTYLLIIMESQKV